MKRSPFAKIIITIIIALLAPVLSYTVFQITQQHEDEALIQSIYDNQLNSILFSVNQHCWDIFRSWFAELTGVLLNAPVEKGRILSTDMLRLFISKHPAVIGLFYKERDGTQILLWANELMALPSRTSQQEELEKINQLLKQASAPIRRARRHATQEGYIRPVIIPWDKWPEKAVTILLLPVASPQIKANPPALMGLFIDHHLFINEVVARKFSEIADTTFTFAVKQLNQDQLLYSTTTNAAELTFERSEKLWILPNLEVLIKMRGTTLTEITRARIRKNLIFVLLVNFVLILGVIYLLRNVSREMKLAQMKTDFVANVSHELRTPLALIRMHAETLEMQRVPSEEKKMHYYRIIMNESARLTQLINNILDFSKIESRKKEYHLVPASLSAVVEKTLSMYQFHLEQKGFELVTDIQSNLPNVNIDESAVTLAFINLLDNAMKFSTDNKQIRVELKQHNQKVILAVKDFGIGIPEAEHQKIFEKFYRVGTTLVHNTKGSGLGLSLVKHIMEIHRGTVTVESKENEGSRFSLIFPATIRKAE